MPLQNKALHCYLLMIIWIVLLIAGVYKFLEITQKKPDEMVAIGNPLLFHNLMPDMKTKRIFKICNRPDANDDDPVEEGLLPKDKWVLKGIIILIRHGDRGSLQHIRNVSGINCGYDAQNTLLNAYKSFLHNLTVNGRAIWTNPGPFHNFPVLPTDSGRCQLGQLTTQGIIQLLQLGQILSMNYRQQTNEFDEISMNHILVYSTRYRRTFQSILAFLYGFLRKDFLTKLHIHESQSMNFCFKDCGCPFTEKLSKLVKQSLAKQLKSHPAVSILAETTGRLLFTSNADRWSDPQVVRDALLTYICHNNPLPCLTPTNCIRRQNVAGIFAYTDWLNYQKWQMMNWKRLCLLRSYGLIKHIVQEILKMYANVGINLVLYSGHDHSIEQLITALGLKNDPLLLKYAARIVFEIYQDNREDDVKGVYFRLLINGKDVTTQVTFCKDLLKFDKMHLCKVEDIVRFIHDDYFGHMNVTNYKDACASKYD